jgi:hypothetical protein
MVTHASGMIDANDEDWCVARTSLRIIELIKFEATKGATK